jgi:RNA polymerase sigma-70 factor (ECF subfamily)
MHTTSASLLDQLRRPAEQEATAAAWVRFVQLYTPLLCYWARRFGLHGEDAADLVQDVLATLVQKLPQFSYDSAKGFRGWLRTVTLNKWRDRLRQPVLPGAGPGDPSLSSIADADSPDPLEETEYRRHLLGQALHLVQTEFAPNTWQAFREYVVAGRPAAEVAAELGVGVGAVYVAKARVLARLRQDLGGLLD